MSEVSTSPQSRAGADRGAAVLGGPLPPPPSRQGSCPLPGARRMEGRAEVASHALQGPALASRLMPHLPSATPAADPVAPVGTAAGPLHSLFPPPGMSGQTDSDSFLGLFGSLFKCPPPPAQPK